MLFFKPTLEKAFQNKERLTSIDVSHDLVVFHTSSHSFTVNRDDFNIKGITPQEFRQWVAACPNIYIHDTVLKDADITIDIQVEHEQTLFDGSLKYPKHYNIDQDLDWCYIVKTKNVLHEKQYQSNEQIVLTDNWVSIILVQHVIGLLKPFCHAAAIDTKNNKDRRLEYSLQFLHDSSIFCDSFNDLSSGYDTYVDVNKTQQEWLDSLMPKC